MTYFILKRFAMPVKTYVQILCTILTLAVFFERYFFELAVYKTANYAIILIILIIAFNTIFLYIIKILRKKKHLKKQHQLYGIERHDKAGFCVVMFVG